MQAVVLLFNILTFEHVDNKYSKNTHFNIVMADVDVDGVVCDVHLKYRGFLNHCTNLFRSNLIVIITDAVHVVVAVVVLVKDLDIF